MDKAVRDRPRRDMENGDCRPGGWCVPAGDRGTWIGGRNETAANRTAGRTNRILLLTLVVLAGCGGLGTPKGPEVGLQKITGETVAPDRSSEPAGLVYPWSVVSGGLSGPAAMTAAMKADPVVGEHYKGLRPERFQARVQAGPRRGYVSYRIRDRVYWTRRMVTIAAGETVLSDGSTEIRGRCGNLISNTPQWPVAPEADEPAEEDMDQPAAASQLAQIRRAEPVAPTVTDRIGLPIASQKGESLLPDPAPVLGAGVPVTGNRYPGGMWVGGGGGGSGGGGGGAPPPEPPAPVLIGNLLPPPPTAPPGYPPPYYPPQGPPEGPPPSLPPAPYFPPSEGPPPLHFPSPAGLRLCSHLPAGLRLCIHLLLAGLRRHTRRRPIFRPRTDRPQLDLRQEGRHRVGLLRAGRRRTTRRRIILRRTTRRRTTRRPVGRHLREFLSPAPGSCSCWELRGLAFRVCSRTGNKFFRRD